MTCAELAALIDSTNAEYQIAQQEASNLQTELMSLWMLFWMQCSGMGAATAPPGDPDSEIAKRAKELVERLQKLGAIK